MLSNSHVTAKETRIIFNLLVGSSSQLLAQILPLGNQEVIEDKIESFILLISTQILKVSSIKMQRLAIIV